MSRSNTEQDFWNRLDKTSNPKGCWEYTGFRNPEGYGKFSYKKKNWLAHRLALHLTEVDVTGKIVCHHCDNPSCCNPSHLYAGTKQDNSNDAVARNRLWSAPGSKNPYSKLTEEQVLDIRSLRFKQALDKYGHIVSRGQICQIRYNKQSWNHI
jgi:hypothetical protein